MHTESATQPASTYLPMGRFGRPYGVVGWIKLISFTDPIDNLLDYDPWYLAVSGHWQPLPVTEVRTHGRALIAKIEGYDTPEAVRVLTGKEIAITAEQLPPLPEGEFFWHQLIGLSVQNTQGEHLGKVDELMNTGAHDVLIVKGTKTHLIPYIKDHFVLAVDLGQQTLTVDWDPAF